MKTLRSRVAKATAVAGAVLMASAALAACSGGSGAQGPGSGVLSVLSSPGGPFVQGLSPFSSTDSPASEGLTSLVYEPLIMFNNAKPTDAPKPWLASDFSWSPDGKTLTFTVPSGRSWSDGTPLTAADVAFTFNLMKKFPALNSQGIDFTGASAPSATSAVIGFSAPAYTQLFSIGKMLIVPEHIWSTVADPTQDANPTPVGSGPYLLGSITPQAMTFTKNPRYWQAGLPKVQTVRVSSYTSQNSAINALGAGQLDWSNLFLPDPAAQFTGRDQTHNKLWLEQAGDFFLCPNTAAKPFDSAAVRQALAYSVDRQNAIPKVEGDYYRPTTSATGLRAGQDQYLPPSSPPTLTYDPAKARQLLRSAGFTGGDTGTLTQPDGKPFNVDLLLPSDYTDWMSLGQLFVNQMRSAGINATLNGESSSAWTSDVSNGRYQLTFCGTWSTDSPFTTYNALLNSKLSAPIGQAAVSNVVRWNDPQVDQALDTYRSTDQPDAQLAAVRAVAAAVAEQMPIIPLMSVSSFGSYSTKRFTGFPSADNPYQTNAFTTPAPLDVILHLEPAS